MPINVTWLLNEQPIHYDDDISVSKVGKHTYILNIDSVSAEHAGNYSCMATNVAGSAIQTANLIVNGFLNTLIINLNVIILINIYLFPN